MDKQKPHAAPPQTQRLRVIAFEKAFVDGQRIRPGQEVEIEVPIKWDATEEGSGVYILPGWARVAGDVERKLFTVQEQKRESKHLEAAIAASGGAAARRKAQQVGDDFVLAPMLPREPEAKSKPKGRK